MPHEYQDTGDTAARRVWQILALPRPDRTASAERRASHWPEGSRGAVRDGSVLAGVVRRG